jgi:hypothetical protein
VKNSTRSLGKADNNLTESGNSIDVRASVAEVICWTLIVSYDRFLSDLDTARRINAIDANFENTPTG